MEETITTENVEVTQSDINIVNEPMYEDPGYTVYVRTNENNVVTAVNSSAFIADTTGWIEVDHGSGDKYHHAQGNYLEKSIIDETGVYNYKLVDGKVVERTDDDKSPEIAKIAALAEIAQLKSNLSSLDYISSKIADGAATREEYAAELDQKAAWRARINELEALYK